MSGKKKEGEAVEQSAAQPTEEKTAVKTKKKTVPPNGNGHGKTKRERIIALAKRPQGCTNAEVFALTERMDGVRWPSVSMPQCAAAVGATLKIVKKKGEATRYFVTA